MRKKRKAVPMPLDVRTRLDTQLRAMMRPHTPRLPGESAEDYVDRITLAHGYTDYLSANHPKKTDLPLRETPSFFLAYEPPPEVAMPPTEPRDIKPPPAAPDIFRRRKPPK